jgi:hypothetical protein
VLQFANPLGRISLPVLYRGLLSEQPSLMVQSSIPSREKKANHNNKNNTTTNQI